VARHLHNIPKGADGEIFAPYLSKGLLPRIDLARTCAADRYRKSPDPDLTARHGFPHGALLTAGFPNWEDRTGERWLLPCVVV